MSWSIKLNYEIVCAFYIVSTVWNQLPLEMETSKFKYVIWLFYGNNAIEIAKDSESSFPASIACLATIQIYTAHIV